MKVKNDSVDFTFMKEKNLPKQCEAFKQELLKLDLKYDGTASEPGEYHY